jgi:peptidoglycan/LPS O-acetylase OafA/YrhL
MNLPVDQTSLRSAVYLPGLDGLRALSVLVVVAFHSGVIDGGWIGVDVFFGISGFLITGLMVAEHERTGAVALGAFWMRRIRRLVPALVVLLGLIALLVQFNQVEVTARNIWGALTYSTNWVHIFGGTSYWDQFATPDPLRHLWSLAIEEQFYVVWPIVAWFVLKRRTPSTLGKVALVGAGISALIQVIGIHAGLSVDRVYQGTDTRAVAFLIGAAIATRGWPPRKLAMPSWLLPTFSLVVLAPAAIWLPGDRNWVFSGPLIVISFAGIAAVVYSTTQTNRLLSSPALRLIGRWSYGIYLFHWPLVVSHKFDGLNSGVRFVVVTVLSIALAGLSYRFIESPIRNRRLPRMSMLPVATVAVAIVVVSLVVSTPTAPALDTEVTLAPRPTTVNSVAVDLPQRVMVFGDSVPAVVADELQAEAKSLGIEIEVRADPGCVPSEEKNDQYGKPECVTFLQGTRARAQELDIDTAIIWWGGTGVEFFEQGVMYDFCAVDAQQIARNRIRRLVAYFEGVATDIILVAPVPRLDQSAKDVEGTECEIIAYDDVATELGIKVVHLRDDVCPSYPDDCERIFRYDGLHYNGEPAAQVAKIILGAL